MKKNRVTIICKSCKKEFEVTYWESKGHITRCEECRGRHGESKTRLYNIWANMKQRCYNPKNTNYPLYGGLGIAVQMDWKNNFLVFKDWAINNGYSAELTLDRIDGNKGYYEDNCRWATQKVQSRNIKQVSKNNKTGYKGVYIRKDGRKKKYTSRIIVDYKEINLGNYYTLEEAVLSYNKYIIDNSLEHTLNILKEK